jgi:hypothetical protein
MGTRVNIPPIQFVFEKYMKDRCDSRLVIISEKGLSPVDPAIINF